MTLTNIVLIVLLVLSIVANVLDIVSNWIYKKDKLEKTDE